MKLNRFHFFTKEIQYFGQVLSTTGIKPLPSKMAAIKLTKPVTNATQVKAFIGLAGYYWKFIMNIAGIAKPLTTLTCHDVKFTGTSGHYATPNTLKML